MASKSFVFRFADVEVREREFSLVKAGETLSVEPKAFRVLLILLRNPGKLISKEELFSAVWGDAAVTENSLTRSIALLRRLLEDDTRNPRYIETVATVGYRFVRPVEVSEDTHGALALSHTPSDEASDEPSPKGEGAASAAVLAEPPDVGKWTPRQKWLLVSSLVALCAIAPAILYMRRPLPPPRVSEYVQITHDDRHKGVGGTDGVRLFVNLDHQTQPIGQVAISGGEISTVPVALPRPWLADVSPDGSTFLLTSYEGRKESLWSFRIAGNSLRHLADGDFLDPVWSPDGNSLVYAMLNGDIDVMRSDGTAVRRLIATGDRPPNSSTWALRWSPDGSTIRFTQNWKLFEMKSDGSELHPLLPGWHASDWQCCGNWTPDGRFFVFLLRHPLASTYPTIPVSQLWVLDERRGLLQRARAEPVQLTSGPIRWNSPIPSKDGKKIFAQGVILRGELVRYDAQSNQLQRYVGGISAEHLSFSPDGQFMAYVTFPEGILWRANRDGSDPVQLTQPPLYPTNPRWSPDGTQIVFFGANTGDQPRIYLISSRGGTPQPLLSEDEKEEQLDPNWSPDGRKVVFDCVTRTGGTVTKTVIRILDLASRQVTIIPGNNWSPRWSPDGRFIAALTFGDTSLTLFDFETHRWAVLQKGEIGYPTWSRDSKFIYFLRPVDDPGVYRIRPSGGDAERVVDLKGFRFTGAYVYWMGLDPDDAPLLLRDTGTDDIYALSLEEK